MTLQRKLIRKAAIERLMDKTSAESRVFENKATPLFSQEAPAILVYAFDEEVGFHTKSPRVYLHTLRLAVELVVKEKSTVRLDSHIDDLAEQIILLLEADRCLGGTCEDLYQTRFEMDISPTAQELVGGARLTFEVLYTTERGEVDEDSLSPLTKIAAKWDLAPPDGTLEAEDLLSLS